MGQIQDLQKRVWANKVAKGFDTSSVEREFMLTFGELNEAFEAYSRELDDLDEEFADVVLYVLGLCEKLGIDFEKAIMKKIDKIEKRKYKKISENHFAMEEEDER